MTDSTIEPLYRIAKWSSVFETSESRKLKQLNWVALPAGTQALTSNGYQLLLDEFPPEEAAAIYGAWCMLVSVASSCRVRGVLGNGRGNPLKLSHIARMTGMAESILARMITWAADPDVGWLEEVSPAERDTLFGRDEESEPPQTPPNPAKTAQSRPSPGDPPVPSGDHRETTGASPLDTGQDRTLPDRTGPNPTQPNNSAAAALRRAAAEKFFERLRERSAVDVEAARVAAGKLHKAVGGAVPDRKWIWLVACVSEHLTPGFCADMATRVRKGDVERYRAYIDGAMRRECENHDLDWTMLRTVGERFMGAATSPPAKREPAGAAS